MRLFRLLSVMAVILAPALAAAQGAPAPIRIPKGSTGAADDFSVAGRRLGDVFSSAGGKTTLTPDAFTGDGSGASAAPPGGELRTIAQALSDEINVKALRAGVCTGSDAIDTAALNLAISKAALSPGSTIRLPACTYKFQVAAGTFGFRLPTGTTLRGDGPRTVVTWNDAEATDASPLYLFGPNDPGVRTANVAFRDFTVRGSGATAGLAPAYPLLPTQIDGITIAGVTSEYSRIMGIAVRGSTDVKITGNVVRYTRSDGINPSQCANVTVTFNEISHTDDDAIGAQSDIYDPWGVRRNLVITNNRIFDAQGIRVFSARHATIANNVLDSIRQHAITVETIPANNATSQEGVAATIAVSITGNSITNLIDRSAVDNLNQGNAAITITGMASRAGSAAAIPGEPAASGAIADPDREYFANSTSTALPTPGSYGVVVSGNLIARTYPATNGADPRFTKWSDLKVGPIWTRNGNVDPSVPESAMRGIGVYVFGGVVRDVLVTGNLFRGIASGLVVGDGLRADNIVFRGNTLVDLSTAGLLVNTTGKSRIYYDDNILDIDPYNKAASRKANGTWASANFPVALYQQQGGNVFARRNTFRNMNQIFPQWGTPLWFFADNYVEADIVSFGAFSTSNKGIGAVPENSAKLRYVRVGSDPASADFGTVLAMPTYP